MNISLLKVCRRPAYLICISLIKKKTGHNKQKYQLYGLNYVRTLVLINLCIRTKCISDSVSGLLIKSVGIGVSATCMSNFNVVGESL